MATQLTMVNNILARLREDTVATIDENVYSKLIARFVNDAKDDLEDINHEWSHYVTEVDVSILADGTRTYDITSTNDRSWLIRQKEDRLPMAFDITLNENGQLYDIPLKVLQEVRASQTSVDVPHPRTFALRKDNVNGGWTIELLWGSEQARDWRTYWYIPQAPLSVADNDDANTEIILPRRPVEMRAVFYALEERGEVMGPRAASSAWLASEWAIASALETDMQVQKKSDENDIRNDEML